jgi:O-antigen/teichoic acid export membrane protein
VQWSVLDGTFSVVRSKLLVIVGMINISAHYYTGILMLQAMTTNNKLVSYYRLALKLAEVLWFIPIVLQTTFIHSTSERWFNDHPEKISELAAQTTWYTFLLTGVLTLGLIVLAWLIGIQPRVLRIHLLPSLVIVPPLGLAVFTFSILRRDRLNSVNPWNALIVFQPTRFTGRNVSNENTR